ncbi:MAG: alpha/beta hydrolase [Sphingomonas sp.]
MRRARRIVVVVLGAALLLYLVLVGGLFLFQRSLLYPVPTTIPARPAGFDDVRIGTSDGLKLRAFYHAAKPGLPTLLFFHGNGGDIAGSAYATRLLVAQGYGALLPEFRGFGGNPGSPSEQGLYLDGDAALRWLMAKGVVAGRVIVIGNSLGSGVATEIAARHKLAGLVLVSGFASLVRAAGDHYPYAPTNLLVLDRFDNVAKLPSVTCPILLLHGTADTIVSVAHARALAQANPSATLELVPGMGHELAHRDVSQAMILAWLRSGVTKPVTAH